MFETVVGNAGLLVRAVMVGVFGGVALVLTHVYSRRGALIFPVYAAILLAAALMLSQFESTSFTMRFAAIFLSMIIATSFALIRVVMHSARVLRRRAQQGLPTVPGSAPWWGMPVVAGSLLVASAGVALVLK